MHGDDGIRGIDCAILNVFRFQFRIEQKQPLGNYAVGKSVSTQQVETINTDVKPPGSAIVHTDWICVNVCASRRV